LPLVRGEDVHGALKLASRGQLHGRVSIAVAPLRIRAFCQ